MLMGRVRCRITGLMIVCTFEDEVLSIEADFG